jgi:hypothetical protein
MRPSRLFVKGGYRGDYYSIDEWLDECGYEGISEAAEENFCAIEDIVLKEPIEYLG